MAKVIYVCLKCVYCKSNVYMYIIYSPVYVDNTADMEITARRILWGKCINLGQTCIAPDYMLCTKDVQEKFIQEAKKVIKEWYGDDAKNSPDLCRIINDRHFQ